MAFQYLGNPYKEQKSLSDYMAVNDARALQQAQGERSIEASDMAIQSAKQKQEMDMVGMGLAGATEADYPARREALLQKGMPEQFLPEQYNPALIDAIMTKTGHKAKSSGMQMIADPAGSGKVLFGDKSTGQYMEGTNVTGGRPFSEMVQAPTQEAAPITPQGSIQTQEVPASSQYDTDGSALPNLEQLTGVPLPPEIPPPAGMPQVPQQIPDTVGGQPMGAPQLTPIPRPDVSNNPNAAHKLAIGEVDNYLSQTAPLSPEAQIKLNNARKAEFKQTTASLNALEENVAATKAAIKNSLAALDAGGGGNQYALGSWIPNSNAGAIAANLETIKSDAITQSLQQMRDASKTGGAVGSLSGTEGVWLGASKGAIDPTQESTYRETLLRRDASLDKVLSDAKQFYKDNYGALVPHQPPAQPYTPQVLSAPATGKHRYTVIK